MHNIYLACKGTIEKIVNQTKDAKTFTVKIPGGFNFLPGQFNMVSIKGFGEVPISISSEPHITDTIEHTIRAVGSVTNNINNFLNVGDEVELRGPYGTPWPVEEAKGHNVLLVIGGLGLAPVRPFITHIFHNRKDYGHFQILYGAREPGEMFFTDEFDEWRKQPGTEFHLTVDKVPDGTEWNHTVGVVTKLYDVAQLHSHNTLVCVCGPEIMMRFACRGLVSRGFFPQQIYLSMERRMKCGVGKCGHCQLGPKFVCKDGPVFRYDIARELPDTLL